MSKSYILSRMDWAKAYRDYEVLKSGYENLLTGGSELQNYVVRYSEATVNQKKLNDYKYNLKTNGGTHTMKALINMRRTNYIEQIKDAFDGGGMVYFMFDVENNTSKEVVFALNGFRDSNNSGVRSEVVISGDYIGTVVIASASMVDGAAYQLQYWTKKVEDNIDINISPIKVSKVKGGKYTPSPKDINPQPYPAQVAHDMYQATEGNWVKAEQDYELLKVGKMNLLPYFTNSDFWTIGAGWEIVSSTKIKTNSINTPSVGTKVFVLKPNTDYTFTFNSDYARYYIYDGYTNNILRSLPTEGSDVVSFNTSETTSNQIRIVINTWSQNLDKTRTVWELKLEEGKTKTPYTPTPKDINASPFSVKLANDHATQQEEITELRNAILQLGGQ